MGQNHAYRTELPRWHPTGSRKSYDTMQCVTCNSHVARQLLVGQRCYRCHSARRAAQTALHRGPAKDDTAAASVAKIWLDNGTAPTALHHISMQQTRCALCCVAVQCSVVVWGVCVAARRVSTTTTTSLVTLRPSVVPDGCGCVAHPRPFADIDFTRIAALRRRQGQQGLCQVRRGTRAGRHPSIV